MGQDGEMLASQTSEGERRQGEDETIPTLLQP
jgi:hypothetical protein